MIQIILEPDMNIEPGRQWIVLRCETLGSDMVDAVALAHILMPGVDASDWIGDITSIRIPHTAQVDEAIVELINQLADIRFKSPNIVQLGLTVDYPLPLKSEPVHDGGEDNGS